MREEMTNEELIEASHCEDCQYYGNKCHCQYETENDTQVWYERGFRFGLYQNERAIQERDARIHQLESWNRELSFQLKFFIQHPELVAKLTHAQTGKDS